MTDHDSHQPARRDASRSRARSSAWSPAQPTSDGAGVKLTRVLTQPLQRRLDPFLMLDAFGTDDPQDYIGGFPDHPHRGFETVTYMIAGRMRHRDSAGHEGLLQNGGVQWMTAGRGVIHSELPEQEDGRMEGFQLWLNLPAKDKMRAPWYRDIQSAEIPEFTTAEGVTVRVIAGAQPRRRRRDAARGHRAAVSRPRDSGGCQLHAGAAGRAQRVRLRVSRRLADRRHATCRCSGWRFSRTTPATASCCRPPAPTRALLIAGKPLSEPIAQYGPFVMNTNDEIFQAVQDYQSGKFVEAS